MQRFPSVNVISGEFKEVDPELGKEDSHRHRDYARRRELGGERGASLFTPCALRAVWLTGLK